MGLRLRSRLGNFGKISRDFGKYSSRPGFSVYNLGKITEIWSRLIFFVYCSLNLNTVIVLSPRKQREKRTRSRISRSRRDLQWTEMDMSGLILILLVYISSTILFDTQSVPEKHSTLSKNIKFSRSKKD